MSIDKNKKSFFKNLKILDIGCGGGLISEPMTRLGADLTSIDASSKNINIAKAHAEKSGLNINYLHTQPEKLDVKNKFDVILNLEVVEHVADLDLYLKSCFNLLKPKGIMFTATLNRTLTSYVKAIVGAEYILRWLPIGTHDWNKFIKPEELEKKITDLNFSVVDLAGLSFNPFFQEWKKTKDLSVNYILVAQKN
jgi:2-polyprenyl-6-hydroxyphenyl methylase/3-demethylubiquinone-9 3-methyltransferase